MAEGEKTPSIHLHGCIVEGIHAGTGRDDSDNIPQTDAEQPHSSGAAPRDKLTETVKITDTITMNPKHSLCPGHKVYRGMQQHLGGFIRDLAIKVLVKTARNEKVAQRLLLLEHPNIVRVIETGHLPGPSPDIFIAMELCDMNLQQYVNKNKKKPYDLKKSFSYSKQLVTAVAYIHEKKIVHRDLKPGNILISMDGNTIKVTDLGFSRDVVTKLPFANDVADNADSHGFKAPETYHESSGNAFKVDIFPLGILIYFIFTNGKHPFGDNPYRRSVSIMDNKSHDLSGFPPFKDLYLWRKDRLVKQLGQMLDPIPNKRPTASEILQSQVYD